MKRDPFDFDKLDALSGLQLLRAPFPAHQIGQIKKGGTLLDFVGHAALTDRLLDVDPLWTWEPLGMRDGLPAFDASGGLWIELTVCGLTRLGYGNATPSDFKEVGSREKECIGDALRNAAMRFGAALELWHKGELHKQDDAEATRAGELEDLAIELVNLHEAGNFSGMYERYCTVLDNEEKVFLWGLLKPSSKVRSSIKRMGEQEKLRAENDDATPAEPSDVDAAGTYKGRL